MKPNEIISKMSFMFISYAIISGGYVTQILPCSIKSLLTNNIYMKHIIGLLLIFSFIMLEGGWSFNKKKIDNLNWTNGNTIHSLGYALLLYITFLMSSKMKASTNMLFYGILFVIYIINTYTNYLVIKKEIDTELEKKVRKVMLYLCYILVGIFIYGIVNYYYYKKYQIGKSFNIYKYIIGTPKCKTEV